METLLNSFKRVLKQNQDYLRKKEIQEVLLNEDIIGDNKKRVTVNHLKQNKFGQISICEDGSITLEIISVDSHKMIFSYYGKYSMDENMHVVLRSYLDCMDKVE